MYLNKYMCINQKCISTNIHVKMKLIMDIGKNVNM